MTENAPQGQPIPDNAAVVIDPAGIIPDLVEDDPKIPVKAVVAALVALATTLISSGLRLPHWLEVGASVVVLFGAVYFAKNPKRVKRDELIAQRVQGAVRGGGRRRA